MSKADKAQRISIDGPAGAGKSTVARMVAQQLGYTYLDTGAMYRAIALAVMLAHISADDEEAVTDIVKKSDLQIKSAADGTNTVYLKGKDVTADIRQQTVTEVVSDISNHKAVRDVLVEKQRQMASHGSCVLDGRDIGTIVLPDAELKIYLTASLTVRAKRRYRELAQKSQLVYAGGSNELSLQELIRAIERRDAKDSVNIHGPMRPADDAVTINTDDMTVDQVVEKIVELAKEKA